VHYATKPEARASAQRSSSRRDGRPSTWRRSAIRIRQDRTQQCDPASLPHNITRALFTRKERERLATVLTPQDESDGDRHVNVTPSTTGTQGSILAGKRPIASPFPDIPVTQASADAEASATERAPDTACSAGELVTAHVPSLGYKTEEPVLYQWQGIAHGLCLFAEPAELTQSTTTTTACNPRVAILSVLTLVGCAPRGQCSDRSSIQTVWCHAGRTASSQ
jgi:ribosomal protein L32